MKSFKCQTKVDTIFDIMNLTDNDTFINILKKTYNSKYKGIRKSRMFSFGVKPGNDYFKFIDYSELPRPPRLRTAPSVGEYKGDSVRFEKELYETMNTLKPHYVGMYIAITTKSLVLEVKSVLRASKRVLKRFFPEIINPFFKRRGQWYFSEKYVGFTFEVEW